MSGVYCLFVKSFIPAHELHVLFLRMGALLDTPRTEKFNESGEGNNLRYGLSSMQGWRISMEDAHCAITQLPGHLKDWSFFAVFDGHAGTLISEKCASQLLKVGNLD